MKTIDLVGYHRSDIGGSSPKRLRAESLVPCVLYGGKGENVHFSVPMILFRELVYTPEATFVNMDIEGTEYKCILKDIQYHPVSEVILHADFLRLYDDQVVKMEIPVHFIGTSPGLQKGGKLSIKSRKLKVQALPKDMPDSIAVALDGLELGQSVKVSSIKSEGFTILNNPSVTVGSITIPRSLRSAQTKDGK
jgi:large subunit ribosomal protein L25